MTTQVPAGYARERERGALIVALPSVLDDVIGAVRTHGSVHAWASAHLAAEPYIGRGAAYRVPVRDADWIVRHYHRGGMIGHINADRYLDVGAPRPLRELDASVAARAAGVPTPEVLAAIVYTHGLMYRGDLVTRFIADSADLAALTWGPRRWSDAARVDAWRAAGALLRVSFAAGVRHADLNLRNVLVARANVEAHALLLDLDRASVTRVDDVARRTMLARFHRSRRKLEADAREPVGAAELSAFESALAGRTPT